MNEGIQTRMGVMDRLPGLFVFERSPSLSGKRSSKDRLQMLGGKEPGQLRGAVLQPSDRLSALRRSCGAATESRLCGEGSRFPRAPRRGQRGRETLWGDTAY